MSNTFSQVYIQLVFAVQGRASLIANSWKHELHKYLAGILSAQHQKPIIINGMPDHIHAFLGLNPSSAIADVVRVMKNNSTNFINEKRFVRGKFAWQRGYGAFSYGHSQIDRVYKCILNQELHHKKKTFKEEYLSFLHKFQVEHNQQYLFDWIE